jgi:hypothetical protein
MIATLMTRNGTMQSSGRRSRQSVLTHMPRPQAPEMEIGDLSPSLSTAWRKRATLNGTRARGEATRIEAAVLAEPLERDIRK